MTTLRLAAASVLVALLGSDRELARGSVVAMAMKLLSAALAFFATVAIARLLGAGDAGLYFLALTLVTILASIARLGLDNTLVKLIAGYHSQGAWAPVHAVYAVALRLAVPASLLLTGFAYVLAEPAAVHLFHKPELAQPLRVMVLAVGCWAVCIVHAQALRGLKYIALSALVGTVLIPLGVIAGNLIYTPEYGLTGAAWSFVGACAVAMLAGVVLWWRSAPQATPSQDAGELLQEVLHSCVPLLLVTVFQLANVWLTTLMLGAWRSAEDVALYGAAHRTALLISFVLVAVNAISAPRFAAHHRRADMLGLEKAAIAASRLACLFAAPVVALVLLLPGQVMAVFGSEFVAGAPLLVVLAIGQCVNVALGSVGYLLIMSGHERQLRDITGIGALFVGVISLYLIPRHGALGAALATSLGLLLVNLLSFVAVKRHLRIQVTFLGI